MDEDLNETSSTSSSSTDILQPQVRDQFHQLAESLKETNQNLLTFEFMLGQYRRLARIAPIQRDSEGDKVKDEAVILDQLKQLAQSVEKLQGKASGKEETVRQDDNKEVHFLRGRVAQLEAQLADKDKTCTSLMEANGRVQNELMAERQKRQVLDQKLVAEQKAAQQIGRDITKYVDKMAALEAQRDQLNETVASLKSESILCQTCLQNDTSLDQVASKVQDLAVQVSDHETLSKLRTLEVKNDMLKEELAKERSERQKLEHCRRQVTEVHAGLQSLEGELEAKFRLADILAERDTLKCSESRLQEDLDRTRGELLATKDTLSRLKNKCKTLLRQYRSKKQIIHNYACKFDTVRKALLDIRPTIKVKDEGYRSILDHFGGQVEISGRLLAAYLDVDFVGPNLSLTPGRRLSDWFCDVQAISLWTHKQLVAFGARYWSGKSDHPTNCILPPLMSQPLKATIEELDVDTVSEISHTLERDLSLASDKDLLATMAPKNLRLALSQQDSLADNFECILQSMDN